MHVISIINNNTWKINHSQPTDEMLFNCETYMDTFIYVSPIPSIGMTCVIPNLYMQTWNTM